MDTEINKTNSERVQFTNIISETKKIIMDEQDSENSENLGHSTDAEVRKAVELLNPDPYSLKSRG